MGLYYSTMLFSVTATSEIYTLSLHDALPILVDTGTNVTVEDFSMFDFGNGVSLQLNAPNYTVRSGYYIYDRDGCVENDYKQDRKSTRLNSSHQIISYAVFCLKKKKTKHINTK